MRVRVYYNPRPCRVVHQSYVKGEHKGRVIGYASSVTLRNAHTVVSEASQRSYASKARTFTYIDGELVALGGRVRGTLNDSG